MSRKKKNQIYINTLMPSTIDEITLCGKVENGFLTVCGVHKQQTQEELPIPSSLDADMIRWRVLSVRYKKGDYRHTEAEYKSLKTIAQWTIDVNCKLRKQEDKKVVWK